MKMNLKNTRVLTIWKSFLLLDTYNEKNALERRRRFFVSFACLFLLGNLLSQNISFVAFSNILNFMNKIANLAA